MAPTLDNILETLHSDKNRLDFLRDIYTPGNTDVADRILAMDESRSVLEREMDYARRKGDRGRVLEMGRRLVDYYVEENFEILLKDLVINWDNEALADYASGRLSEPGRTEYSLERAVEIAEAFGKKDKAKEFLESLLERNLEDERHLFPAAKTLAKLGRHDEAIDRYLQCKSHGWVGDALAVAQEHSPHKIDEVAQAGFDRYNAKNGFKTLYVECAEILGKTDVAKKTLLKEARNLTVDSPPRWYDSLVSSLVKFGEDDAAREVVAKVSANEEKFKDSNRYYGIDRLQELAGLYHAIDEVGKVKEIYTDIITTRIRENHHPSNTMKDIDDAIKLTGDQSFFERKIEVFEGQQEYANAAGLARELGKTDLANIYDTMQAMVASK